MSAPSEQRQIEILLKVQRLLEDSDFQSTYKFALLQALVDLAVETGADDADELLVPTYSIAERFIASYWPQVRPFAPLGTPTAAARPLTAVAETESTYSVTPLRQGPGKDDAIPRAVRELSEACGGSLARARTGPTWRRAVMKVRATVCALPLWHLQAAGNPPDCFLYAQPPGQKLIDSVTLHAGVAFTLRRFQHLLREMVRGAWIGYIRRLPANRFILGDAEDLHEFLFGQHRRSLEACRAPLCEMQEGRCLYCPRPLMPDTLHVDHFIPWRLYPSNLTHNLVASCAKCNGAKRDHLVAIPHLETWRGHMDVHGAVLAAALGERGVVGDMAVTLAIARWAYRQKSDAGGHVWQRGTRELVPLDDRWRGVLA